MSSIAERVRSVRLPRVAAVLCAAVALVASDARASQVTITLPGKVLVLAHTGNINAELQLAAKGVSAGVPASMELVLEDATPAVQIDAPYVYQQYNMAIVDLKLTAGTWEAHFAPPAGMEATNWVQVNDNSDYITKFDGWNGTALGVDTEDILSQGSAPSPYGTFFIHFLNSPPVPATTDALVQDLKKYKSETQVRFFGNGGTITIDFTGASAGAEAALARKGQLKAAAKLGSSVLKGLGKLTAAGPDKDPGGAAKDTLLQTASDKFGVQFVAAISKALKKGGTAPLGESDKGDATALLMKGLQSQAEAIVEQEDVANAIDRAMRGAILKALAAECRADFLAHAKDVMLPDSAKLNAKLEKDREQFITRATAAMDKALKKNVFYSGPTPAQIANELKPFVNAFVDLTSTGE
jgi:hypothetical protein